MDYRAHSDNLETEIPYMGEAGGGGGGVGGAAVLSPRNLLYLISTIHLVENIFLITT